MIIIIIIILLSFSVVWFVSLFFFVFIERNNDNNAVLHPLPLQFIFNSIRFFYFQRCQCQVSMKNSIFYKKIFIVKTSWTVFCVLSPFLYSKIRVLVCWIIFIFLHPLKHIKNVKWWNIRCRRKKKEEKSQFCR